MRTPSQALASFRNAAARLLATKPIPDIAATARTHSLQNDGEANEALMLVGLQLAQIADYFARSRAAQDEAGLHGLVERYLQSDEGQAAIFSAVVGSAGLQSYLNGQIDFAVKERVTPRVSYRDRWHVPSMFSWLGAIIGGAVGAVLGIILNIFLDAGTVSGEVGGKQYVGADIIDSLPGQCAIVGIMVLACAALGAALLNRSDDN